MFKKKTFRVLTMTAVAGVLVFSPVSVNAQANRSVVQVVASAATKNIETSYFKAGIAENYVFSDAEGSFSIAPKAGYAVICTVDGSEPKLGSKNTTYIKSGNVNAVSFKNEKLTFKFKAIKDTGNDSKNKTAFQRAKTQTNHYSFRILNSGASVGFIGKATNDKVTVNDFDTIYTDGMTVCRDQAIVYIDTKGRFLYDANGALKGRDASTAVAVTYTLDGKTSTVKANDRKEITVKTPGRHTFSYTNPETGERIVKNFYVDTISIKSSKGKAIAPSLYQMSRNITGYKYYNAVFTTNVYKEGKNGADSTFTLAKDVTLKADGSTFTILSDNNNSAMDDVLATFTIKAGQKINIPYDKLKKYGYYFCEYVY